MDFGRFDMVILTTSVLAVIIMSFTFPTLGLAGASNETATGDIPEFSISSSEWDIAGDFPDSPGQSNAGELLWGPQDGLDIGNTEPGYSLRYIDRPPSEGATLEIQNLSDGVDVVYANRSGGSVIAVDRYNLSGDVGQQIVHRNNSWTIEFEVTQMENFNTSQMNATVEYEIKEDGTGSSGGLLSGIPIVGGLVNAGSELAGGLIWIGEIIYWAVAFLFEITLTLVGILLAVIVFGVDLLSFLTGSYTDIVTGADSWAAVVLLVPAILLFAEFVKIGMLGVKLLPTT